MGTTVAEVAASIRIEGLGPAALRETAVTAAMEGGLDWHQTVTLVDELERMTGLQLHSVKLEPGQNLRSPR